MPAAAAVTNNRPISASCTAGQRRSVQCNNSAPPSAAPAAAACTASGASQSIISATITPSPATCAMARSIKMMPRRNTSMPSGTWVAKTPEARDEGRGQQHQIKSHQFGAHFKACSSRANGVVEQRCQVFSFRRATDAKGQDNDGQLGFGGQATRPGAPSCRQRGSPCAGDCWPPARLPGRGARQSAQRRASAQAC